MSENQSNNKRSDEHAESESACKDNPRCPYCKSKKEHDAWRRTAARFGVMVK